MIKIIKNGLYSITGKGVKPVLVVGLLLVSFLLFEFTSKPQPERTNPASLIPAPTEHILDENAERRNKKYRKQWIAERHRAPPELDWKQVELLNAEEQLAKRNRIAAERKLRSQLPTPLPDPNPTPSPDSGLNGSAAMSSAAVSSVWTERGSDNQAGRMHRAVVAPDGQSIYAGSAGGGIWQGSLDGTNWTPLGDNIAGGAPWIAVVPGATPSDPNVMLRAAKGQVHFSQDNGDIWDIPAGLPTTISNIRRITETNDGNFTIFMVVEYYNYTTSTVNTDIYRSTDAAQSFSSIYQMGTFAGDVWVPRTLGGGPIYALGQNGVEVSSDDGDTWLLVGPLPGAGLAAELVGSEAGAPRLWSVMDVSTPTEELYKLYRSDDAGVSWVFITDVNDYWRSLSASIVDVDLFATGGVEVWRTTDGGTSFNKVNEWWEYYNAPATTLHADIPGITVAPCIIDGVTCFTGETWYISTDGGLFRSLDGIASVENLSLDGLRVSQYYSTLTSSANPMQIAAGSQDQGYQWTDAAPGEDGLRSMDQIISGDYGHLTSGDGTHSYVYSTYPGLMLVQFGQTNPPLTAAIQFPESFFPDEIHAWLPPITADPLDIESVFFCASKLYRYKKDPGQPTWTVELWSTHDFQGTPGEYLTSLVFSPMDAQRAYAVTNIGRLFYSNDHAVTWTEAANSGPQSHYFYGTALLASATDIDTVYIGGSGYASAPVWRSTDGGITYTAYGDGLPSTLVYCLTEAPDGSGALYAGTETAAYRRDAGATSWLDITSNEAPLTVYWSCESVLAEQVIRFGTYGRGIWDYDYTALAPNEEPNGSIDQPISNLTITAGESVIFNGTGTDPDGNLPLTYIWDFSGGAPNDTNEDPGAVTFNVPGTYVVNLTVTDGLGVADPTPASVTITVNATLYADADTYARQDRPTDSYGSQSQFIIKSGSSNARQAFLRVDTSSITPGTQLTLAKLRVWVNNSRTSSLATIDLHNITEPWVEIPASWQSRTSNNLWTTSGGTYDQAIVASNTLSAGLDGLWLEFDITELAQEWVDSPANNNGVLFKQNTSKNIMFRSKEGNNPDEYPHLFISVNQAPSGNIDQPAGDQTITAGESVTFASTGTDADNNTPLTYSWDFAGGATNSSLEDPGAVTFTTPGTYAVNFTVTDSLGLADPTPASVNITVNAPPNQAPDSIIDAPGDTTIIAGDSVTFTGTGTDPDGNTPLTYDWNFGGGATDSTLEDPGAVTFSNPGIYTVIFTVTDSFGLADASPASVTITVNSPPNQAPESVIDLPSGDVTITAGDSVTFAGTATDPDGFIFYVFWNFAGGAADSTDEDPGAITFSSPGIYNVTFTAIDNLGLADPSPASVTITVNAPNVAPDSAIDLPIGDTTIIAGDAVTFNGTGTDADGNTPLTYLWNFNGGAADSTDEDPGTVTFSTPGIYTVNFTVTDSLGLSDPSPASVIITVNAPNVTPDSAIDLPIGDTTIIAGDSVTFNGTGTDADGNTPLTYDWNFGGGATDSTLEDPGAVTFSTPGIYTVNFTVTDSLGLADATPASVIITVNAPNQAPDSIIDAPGDTTIIAGDSVTFSGTGTDADGNTPLTYDWNFGGGATDSTLEDPGAVTFSTPGEYVVNFTVTDSLGLADATPASVTITVNAPNVAPDSAIDLPIGDTTIIAGDAVTFSGTGTDPDGNTPLTYLWNFNGGATDSTLEDPGAVTFSTPGIYTVNFTVTDSLGLADPSPASVTITVNAPNVAPDSIIDAPGDTTIIAGDSVTFSGTGTDADGNTPLTYDWNFGGGATDSTLEDPGAVTFSTPGIFMVNFTVTDSLGLADATPASVTITVNAPNVAPDSAIDLPIGDTTIIAGDAVTFTGTGTDADGNTPLTYLWNFNGGAADSTDEDPGAVTFSTPGIYTVNFTVTDSLGLSDPSPASVIITVNAPNVAPDSIIDAPGDTTIIAGDAVTFSGTGTDPDGNTPLTYDWNFGGGATDSTLEDPGAVTFSTPGVYTVTFTVTDSLGLADATPASVIITVNAPNQVPDSIIDAPGDTTIIAGDSVTFSGTGTDADGNTPLTYDWSFGGGATDSTLEDPGAVTFSTPGIYTVTFTVTDSLGLADATPASVTITVNAPNQAPDSIIDAPGDTTIIAGDSVTFTGTGTDPDGNTPLTYDWNFGGGATDSTLEDPGAVTFSTPGIYTVTFTVTDSLGLGDATPASVTITVNAPNQAPDSIIDAPGDTTIIAGDSVTFNGTGTDPDGNTPLTYDWNFGGGATDSTLEDPGAVTFSTPGTFVVNFTVTDSLGLADATPASVTITVNAPNVAPDSAIDLPIGDTTIIAGDSVTFSGTGTDADGNTPLTYLWNFNGGAADSTDEDPGAVTFSTPGIYNVTFTAIDNLGLADPSPASVTITVNAPNVAPDSAIDLPIGDTTIIAGDSVTFSGTGTDADGNTPLTYLWNFNGGAADSTDEDPGAVTFSTPGIYTVTFTVTDSLGLADATPASVTITVNAPNQAPDSIIDAPGDTTIIAGDSVTFNGTGTDADGNTPLTYLWSFNGGATDSTLEDPGAVTFSTPGIYTVTFTVTDSLGLADATPASVTITVNAPNVAPDSAIDLPIGDTTIIAGDSVTFNGTGTDPDGNTPLTYDWNFGGGATDSTLEDPGAVTFSTPGTFVVNFTVTDSLGLADATPASVTITVNAPNVAPDSAIDLPIGDTTIIAGDSVTFSGTGTDADGNTPLTYLWNFNGGAADSTDEDPGAVTFSTPGIYNVTFTAIDNLGLADPSPASVTITVNAPNVAPDSAIDLPIGDTTIIAGDSVTFSGTGTDADGNTPLTYLWNFNGGAADSTDEDPGAVTFSTPGIYTVTFTVTDSLGLADATPASVTITVNAPNQAPDSIIDAPGDTTIIAGDSVTFNGTGTDADGNTPLTYLWSFNGGATDSTLEDPGAVTFSTPGIYTVTFTVTDSLGLADATPASVTITVNAPNVAPDSAIDLPIGDTTIIAGDSVTFNGTGTDPDGNTPLTYDWNFGGGASDSTLEDPGAVTFSTPGTFVVNFTVTDSLGLADATPASVMITVNAPNVAPDSIIDAPGDTTIIAGDSVTFNGTGTDADGNTPLTYLWSFNGGATDSTLEDPGAVTFSTPGIYTVTFTVTDSLGLADATPASVTITVNAPNVAPDSAIDLPIGDTTIIAGDSVTFNGTGTDPDGNTPLTYDWNFGGGASDSTLEDPGAVTFSTPGTFVVNFTVTDSLGLADATPASVTFTVNAPNVAPDSAIDLPIGDTTIIAGDSVTFSGTGTDADGNTPLTYLWNFNGGAADSTDEDPGAVTFSTPGIYTVTFTVTDSLGLADATPASVTITVNAPNQAPDSIIDAPGDTTIIAGDSVTFTGTGTDPDGNTPLTYDWNFGGGATDSTLEDPGAVTFSTPGIYNVTFTAIDNLGLADPSPASVTITVNAPNVAPDSAIDLPIGDTTIIAGDSVAFSGTGTDPDGNTPLTYFWNFNGGASNSTLEDPGAVTFSTPGIYTVTFTVTDSLGLGDATPASVTITVNALPVNVTLYTDADSYVRLDKPTNNYGNQSNFIIKAGSRNARNGLLHVDTSLITPGSQVTQAKLRVWVSENRTRSFSTISVHEILESWTESAASWISRTSSNAWATSGGTYDPTIVSSITLPAAAEGIWLEFDITALVQQWVDSPANNYGVLFKENTGRAIKLSSKESGDSVEFPHLIVTY